MKKRLIVVALLVSAVVLFTCAVAFAGDQNCNAHENNYRQQQQIGAEDAGGLQQQLTTQKRSAW